MSDVTHYARARKWLDDPATVIPDDVRATLDAALAVSTAQRETEKAIGRLTARVDVLTTTLEGVGRTLAPRPLVQIGDIAINPAAVTMIERDYPDAPSVEVHMEPMSRTVSRELAAAAGILGAL